MYLEIKFLLDNKAWVLVPQLKSRFVISNCWVLKIKYRLDGRIIKYKTCWVVHEYK